MSETRNTIGQNEVLSGTDTGYFRSKRTGLYFPLDSLQTLLLTQTDPQVGFTPILNNVIGKLVADAPVRRGIYLDGDTGRINRTYHASGLYRKVIYGKDTQFQLRAVWNTNADDQPLTSDAFSPFVQMEVWYGSQLAPDSTWVQVTFDTDTKPSVCGSQSLLNNLHDLTDHFSEKGLAAGQQIPAHIIEEMIADLKHNRRVNRNASSSVRLTGLDRSGNGDHYDGCIYLPEWYLQRHLRGNSFLSPQIPVDHIPDGTVPELMIERRLKRDISNFYLNEFMGGLLVDVPGISTDVYYLDVKQNERSLEKTTVATKIYDKAIGSLAGSSAINHINSLFEIDVNLEAVGLRLHKVIRGLLQTRMDIDSLIATNFPDSQQALLLENKDDILQLVALFRDIYQT